MVDRPRFFDDLAGAAGTAFSAFSGIREEIHALIRSRIDEVLYSLDLVRREEFEVVQEMASRARQSQEEAETRLAELENRISKLEQHQTKSSHSSHH
ncbi:accessory factor UbiK family protein [Acetobacteraceae bacterium ESL0709]|nr:accessory factor UbiK family protein [Acetobacteraceae bacterium ESL0697]MDF7677194.1 accessory factor UbiK family protein [Acetobacteraceae bacterium ESL0709]